MFRAQNWIFYATLLILFSAFDRHPRIYVRRRGQRGPGPTPGLPQDGGATQSQGPGRSSADHQARVTATAGNDYRIYNFLKQKHDFCVGTLKGGFAEE
jgi:hypothetical protein